MKKWLLDYFPPFIPLLTIGVLLELLVSLDILPQYLVPKPSDVLSNFREESALLGNAFLETSCAAASGFCLSLSLGIFLGVLLFSSKRLERILFPYITLFQTVPVIALAPLLVIWFGYGIQTSIISALIVSIFPVISATLKGLLSTDPALVDLFRIYGASKWTILTKLRAPYSIPTLLVGAEISSGLAVIGAIVGEFISGGGLGGLIDTSRTQQRVDLIGSSLLLAAALGIGLLYCVKNVSRRLLSSWHPSA